MAAMFNALEVLTIAEQIEKNGVRFYTKAAEIFNKPDVCKILLQLIKWETKHEKFFADMRNELSQTRTFESWDSTYDPKWMAGLGVFGIRSDPKDELSGKESEEDILKRAIQKEKDSIVFYNGLRDFVPIGSAKKEIENIIEEEKQHIKILNRLLDRKN